MGNHNHYGYDSDVEQMTDHSPYSNNQRSRRREGDLMRVHFSSPYANPFKVAERIFYLRDALLKGERGYGPFRRSMSLVRSRPYGSLSIGPKGTGSTSKGVEFEWTLDRHKRFVNAVEMLGGDVRAASWPRAILELMKEEGLTKDIVLRHLHGLRQLLSKTEITPISESNLFNVHGSNGNGSNSTRMPAGDHQEKVASNWSSSGSYEDVLNNFSELNLKHT